MAELNFWEKMARKDEMAAFRDADGSSVWCTASCVRLADGRDDRCCINVHSTTISRSRWNVSSWTILSSS